LLHDAPRTHECNIDNKQGVIGMNNKFATVALAVALISGCASVPMESKEASAKAKQFNPPSEGNSGLYIYRDSFVGKALKKDIWVDGKCLGESAPDVFFYEEVKGDQEHKLSTESEFSPNDLTIKTAAGMNYFINQYIKMGVFVGGAGLELVNEEEGKKAVTNLELAKKGPCS
jgi:hypothetical protein